MGVQHLLKLRMASLHPHPAAPPATRPLSALSSLLFAPSPAAASSPRPASLACSRAYCPAVGPAAGRCRGTSRTVGRRVPGVAVAMSSSAPTPGPVQKSEEEWEAILTPEQFRILRRKGTEYPGTGEYDKFFDEGVYGCAGCGTPLYKSSTKFNSGCGWPAFYEGFPGAIARTVWFSHPFSMIWQDQIQRILMGGELRSHVLLVEDIWGMCSRGRGSTRQPMSGIASTVSHSSLFRHPNRLVD